MMVQEVKLSEIQIQSKVFQYLWNNYPETRDCFYHVASEAKRTVIEWGQQKASGFRKGIQDINFLFNKGFYPIEFKSEGGEITPHQKAVHSAHARQGFPTHIFYNSEDGLLFLECIIKGGDISEFNSFISPYSKRPDLYKQLAKEARQSDCKHVGNPCKKCFFIAGTKPTVLF